MNSPRSVIVRATSLELATTALTLGLLALLGPPLDLDPAQPFAVLLTQWCTVALLGCAAWAWATTSLVLLEALRAAASQTLPHRRRGIPAGYRRLVLGACGVALSAGVATPALGTPGPVHLDPLPASIATPVGTPVTPARAPIRVRPSALLAADILVRPGDSLWRLAAARLPQDVDDATIAHSWHRLYAANSELIGVDPDHIEPGQRLRQPQGW
jgi:hypothetical protein